ncbi:MAG: ABC transporter permease [Chloroflexota bacterium]
MRNIWTIAKREYNHYFISPIAYVVAFAILLAIGVVFGINFFYYAQNSFQNPSAVPDISAVTGVFVFLLVLSTPALTMRLISDEARMGTLELLLTAPLKDSELVIGKWLGAMLYILSLVAVTLIYPIILNGIKIGSFTLLHGYVSPGIDVNVVLTSYLGVILIAGVFLALGTGISAMFTNQIASFFGTLILFVFLWWLVGFPANVISGNGAEFFRYLDMKTHFYDTLSIGKIVFSDLVYYISLIALGLFTGTVAVEMRRWR